VVKTFVGESASEVAACAQADAECNAFLIENSIDVDQIKRISTTSDSCVIRNVKSFTFTLTILVKINA
jgi:hypothetical protein